MTGGKLLLDLFPTPVPPLNPMYLIIGTLPSPPLSLLRLSAARTLEKAFAFALAPQASRFFAFIRARARASRCLPESTYTYTLSLSLSLSLCHARARINYATVWVVLYIRNTREDTRTRLCPRKRRSVWHLHSVLPARNLPLSYNSSQVTCNARLSPGRKEKPIEPRRSYRHFRHRYAGRRRHSD